MGVFGHFCNKKYIEFVANNVADREFLAKSSVHVTGAYSDLRCYFYFHNTASMPLRCTRFSSLSDGPLGRLLPTSHFCTVDTLVFKMAANTA